MFCSFVLCRKPHDRFVKKEKVKHIILLTFCLFPVCVLFRASHRWRIAEWGLDPQHGDLRYYKWNRWGVSSKFIENQSIAIKTCHPNILQDCRWYIFGPKTHSFNKIVSVLLQTDNPNNIMVDVLITHSLLFFFCVSVWLNEYGSFKSWIGLL